jgi:hypothetical protein
VLEVERANTRVHCMEISLWKRLWTCRKTDFVKDDDNYDILVQTDVSLQLFATLSVHSRL